MNHPSLEKKSSEKKLNSRMMHCAVHASPVVGWTHLEIRDGYAARLPCRYTYSLPIVRNPGYEFELLHYF